MNPDFLDARQTAILDVAQQLLLSGGQDAVSMASLAKGTGLSRPAIYQYFASREHVLGELVINELADMSNELDRLLKDIADPLEQVRIWIHYSLAHLASAEHKAISAISTDTLPEDQRGMFRAMHGYLMTTLVSPISELGAQDPTALCGLIFGSVSAAARRIEQGSPFANEAQALETFVMAGLEAAIAN